MTDTTMTLAEANDARKQHVRDICNSVATLLDIVNRDPDLYFGGYPASLDAIRTVCRYQADALAQNVGLGSYDIAIGAVQPWAPPAMMPPTVANTTTDTANTTIA